MISLRVSLGIQVNNSSSSSSEEESATVPETPETPTPPTSTTNDMDFWLTKANRSAELQKQAIVLGFGTTPNAFPNIEVDENQTFQTIDGFGFTLTGGSAQVINGLETSKKGELLDELFGDSATSIGISYLRISVGASDLNETSFTYDDLPEGETDLDLSQFSLDQDSAVISLLREIIAINPQIKKA